MTLAPEPSTSDIYGTDFPRIDVPKIEIFKTDDGYTDARGVLPIEQFVTTYFPHYLRDKSGRDVLTPHFHREVYYLMENLEKYESVIWVCPRGFGKSVLIFFGVLYDALVTKKFGEQMLIGATQPLAERWLLKIKTELTDNELLIKGDAQAGIPGFGEICTDGDKDGKWSNDEIKLRNGERIYAKGAGASVRGPHPGKVLLDDVENDEQAASPTQVDKMEEWIRGAVINMQIDESSSIFWAGTFIERGSVLQKAYEGDGWDDSWFRLKHEAIWTEDSEKEHPRVSTWHPYKVGEPIWPDRHKNEIAWLRRRERKIGMRKFAAEFMNDPRAKERQIFNEKYFRYYEEDDLPKVMRTFQVVDPSVGETSKADESGFVIFGLDGGNRPSPDIFILDAEGEILDEMALARKAVNNHIRHRCSHLTIEKVAFQAFVANAVEREMTEQHVWVPINLVNPAAKDKQTRARSVSYLFERGHVRIRKDQTQLIEQLKAFPRKGVKKDTVDALVYGLMELVHHWEDVDMANKRAKAREEPEAEKERDEYAIEELAM